MIEAAAVVGVVDAGTSSVYVALTAVVPVMSTLAGSNVPVTPAGKPVAERVTVPVKPFDGVIVIGIAVVICSSLESDDDAIATAKVPPFAVGVLVPVDGPPPPVDVDPPVLAPLPLGSCEGAPPDVLNSPGDPTFASPHADSANAPERTAARKTIFLVERMVKTHCANEGPTLGARAKNRDVRNRLQTPLFSAHPSATTHERHVPCFLHGP
jgi:hypothetical protein